MIKIKPTKNADTRTCDVTKVTKEELLDTSHQHIKDVVKAMGFFISKLVDASGDHDFDKLTEIDWFYKDFQTSFKEMTWWDNHRKIHRHHLAQEDGVPDDVNLLDILEYIADCVMVGKGRKGLVDPLVMSPELLMKSFQNTIDLLDKEVTVVKETPQPIKGRSERVAKKLPLYP
jgi:hypothetical protein